MTTRILVVDKQKFPTRNMLRLKPPSDLGAITPCLENLKEVNVITTLGAPWWVDFFVLRKPVKKVIKIALLGACARNCKFQMLSLYKSENLTGSKVENFVKKIKTTF